MAGSDKSYFRRMFLQKDQGWNVKYSPLLNWYYDTDEFGNEDETLSSVCGRLERYGRIISLRNAINWLFSTFAKELNHCVNNIEERFL